jgi:UTP--glucose-1-phosphate uridylyltransferase
VMLGDDIMVDDAKVLSGMIETHAETGCSVVALMEVPIAEIGAYGCAAVDRADGVVRRITELVEKPAPEVAPSNLAIMGRYLLTPAIFDRIDALEPGVGGEIQLTDAIAALMEDEAVYGYTFSEGRFDIGKKIDYLRATVELALTRDDLRDDFLEVLRDVVAREAGA